MKLRIRPPRNDPSRDGDYDLCDDCGQRGYVALTSEGWICSECLDDELLREVLDLHHRAE